MPRIEQSSQGCMAAYWNRYTCCQTAPDSLRVRCSLRYASLTPANKYQSGESVLTSRPITSHSLKTTDNISHRSLFFYWQSVPRSMVSCRHQQNPMSLRTMILPKLSDQQNPLRRKASTKWNVTSQTPTLRLRRLWLSPMTTWRLMFIQNTHCDFF